MLKCGTKYYNSRVFCAIMKRVMFMKKAIQIGYDNLFELKCNLAAKAGFKYISANYYPMLGKTDAEWEAAIENTARILDETGLSCIQIHPYYYDLLISSEKREESHEYAIHKAIEAGGRLGAEWVAIHPRSNLTTGLYRSKSFEDNKKDLSAYLETATKFGTGIAAENLLIADGITPIIPFYSWSCEDLCALVDSFDAPNMGICWDTGHANLIRFDQATAIRFMGERIKCTHIHNNFGKNDDHLTPDQGTIPWKKVMKAFAEVNYGGPLTLETHCCYTEPALLESFAAHNLNCLKFLENLR